MDGKCEFSRKVLKIALPITLQCLLQSSFSVVDQIMVGQLGGVAVAGIGLGGRFSSIYSVVLAAIASAAGIAIAQYVENSDVKYTGRSFYQNFVIMLALASGFTVLSICLPMEIMGLYSRDAQTVRAGADYLRIAALSFVPMSVISICSVYMRCKDAAALPLYAGVAAALLNTILNYGLIFGKLGFPALGVKGAAWATAISQLCGCGAAMVLFVIRGRRDNWRLPFSLRMGRAGWRQYLGILLPILVCEFFWALGENVYAAVYGHIGTDASAAMTLTNPIQSLMIGALTGVSQSAGILVGRDLGRGDFDSACNSSKRLLIYGLTASVVLSVFMVIMRRYYLQIFRVEPSILELTDRLLIVYAVLAPLKVQNMILGGGILRSGGQTKYTMYVDLMRTWAVGVPLAFMSAFVFELPVFWVYFIHSQDELAGLVVSLWIFRRKRWMNRLETSK